MIHGETESIRVLSVVTGLDIWDDAVDALDRDCDRFALESANTADDAVERVRDERFDCVVSTYSLPETTGTDVLEAVRTEDPDLPFVLVAETDDAPAASDAIAAGATEYVRVTGGADRHALLAHRVRTAAERARTERDLRETERLLDQLFEQVPISLYIKDEAGRHLRMSDFYENDPEAAIGKTDRELYPEFGDETYRDDMRVIETGEPIIDKEEPRSDEGDAWNLTSKVPWYGEDGEIKGLIGVTRNIDERKQYEQELRRQNERLTQFASIVSHDLRNPLNVASGRLELARADCESEHLDVVADALERMDALITDLLTLAREGEGVSELEPVSLGAVSERCWQTVETADATLVTDGDETIRADPTRLEQLLTNLFRNAVEHGGANVTVRVGALDDRDGFYVADDGAGVPENERGEVFEMGHSTKEDGTGLGLNIVDGIATAHGWDVAVTDSEAGGARFEVTGVDVAE